MARQGWSPDVRVIGDRLAALTVAGAAELRDYLEEVHGVRPAGSGAPPPVVEEPVPDEETAEPADLDVLLDGYDPARRVGVIRLVRETTGLALKEARDLVDSSPRVVRQGVPRADAEKLRAVLEAAGGRVVLRAAAS